MSHERTVEIALAAGVALRFSQAGQPIDRYSVVLLLLAGNTWQAVRVYDNHLGTHHMHRYTPSSGKQGPETFHTGTTNEAIAAAIAHLKAHWPAIIQSWKT